MRNVFIVCKTNYRNFLPGLKEINYHSTSKTKYSLFHSVYKKPEISQNLSPLKINDTLAEKTKTSKFLGVALDENLLWKPHIDGLAVKTF